MEGKCLHFSWLAYARPRTGFHKEFGPLRLATRCKLFWRGVTYSRFPTALLLLFISRWLICVCSGAGGGPRKAYATRRWTRSWCNCDDTVTMVLRYPSLRWWPKLICPDLDLIRPSELTFLPGTALPVPGLIIGFHFSPGSFSLFVTNWYSQPSICAFLWHRLLTVAMLCFSFCAARLMEQTGSRSQPPVLIGVCTCFLEGQNKNVRCSQTGCPGQICSLIVTAVAIHMVHLPCCLAGWGSMKSPCNQALNVELAASCSYVNLAVAVCIQISQCNSSLACAAPSHWTHLPTFAFPLSDNTWRLWRPRTWYDLYKRESQQADQNQSLGSAQAGGARERGHHPGHSFKGWSTRSSECDPMLEAKWLQNMQA